MINDYCLKTISFRQYLKPFYFIPIIGYVLLSETKNLEKIVYLHFGKQDNKLLCCVLPDVILLLTVPGPTTFKIIYIYDWLVTDL